MEENINYYQNKTNINIPFKELAIDTPYLNLVKLCKNNLDKKDYKIGIGYTPITCMMKDKNFLLRHSYILNNKNNVVFDLKWVFFNNNEDVQALKYCTVAVLSFDKYIHLIENMTEIEANKATELLVNKAECKAIPKNLPIISTLDLLKHYKNIYTK